MANLEVLALDTAVPQIRAPGVGDGYTFPRDVTLATGTANGVLYLNGSKVATSGSALTFDGDALTLGGTTPRLRANMSGAQSTRFAIQNSTTDGNTRFFFYPNGTGSVSAIQGWNTSNLSATDYQLFDFGIISTIDIRLTSGVAGAASYLPITFYNGGGEKMRLDSSGNLGIGTTAPQAVLDLGSGSVGRALTWSGSASTRYASIFTAFSAADIVLGYGFHGSSSADSYLSSWTGTLANAGVRVGTGTVQFFTNTATAQTAGNAFTPTERMRLTSAGELLVGGTTAINSSSGFIACEKLNGQSGIALFRNDTSISTGNVFGSVDFYGNDTTANAVTLHAGMSAVASGDHAAGDNPTDILFNTTPDGTATAAEAGRITQAGSYVLKGGTTTAAAGVGIIFPATQVASANANSLDDYEEGTWTPTVEGSTSPGTGGYTTQIGRYTRIGRVVTCQAYIAWTSHTGTGNLYLTGLPFTLDPTTDNHPSATIGLLQNVALTAGNIATAYGAPNSTRFNLIQYPTGGGAITFVPMDTAGEIIYSATYITAT